MADIKYMKAVEFDKLPAAFKKKYESENGLEAAGYWLQKKYDGCFGKAIIKAGSRKACKMLSRTGEDYSVSCGLILDSLFDRAQHEGRLDFVVLGEVWAPDMKFPAISGAFRRQSTGMHAGLVFVVNDLLPADMETARPYNLRYDDALEFVGRDYMNLMVAKTYTEGDWGDAQALSRVWVAEGGYDGAILRNPQSGYTFGLVKDGAIVKVKPLLELDLSAGTLRVSTGGKTGRDVYTMDVTYRGVTTAVGSGMPHAYLDCPTPGQIVRIDCLGLTEDGKLREPRYIGIRHDKTQPDT